MAIITYCENIEGKLKKASLEALTYAHKLAGQLNLPCYAVATGNPDESVLQQFGVEKYINIEGSPVGDSQVLSEAIAQGFKELSGKYLILPYNSTGKTLTGQLAVQCDAAAVTLVNALPQSVAPLQVQRSLFAGKASAVVQVDADKAILALQGNAIQPEEKPVGGIEKVSLDVSSAPKVEVIKQEKLKGGIPLPEADLVVSGGRGFKGPENWSILLELAETLGAATACSRPVADADWRPHHEHVGQTGIAISPNLYIAIGISGAIQHLGGVNNSKTIVVINNDPEAPFFKAADYGIVGDLFDVVPKLTEAIKAFQAKS